MTDRSREDALLDELFSAAQSDPRAHPSADFMARILEDAEAHLPEAPALPEPVRRSFLGQLFNALGGWRPVAGLAMATVAGVWIGFSGLSMLPGGVNDLLGPDSQYYLADLEPGFVFDNGEG